MTACSARSSGARTSLARWLGPNVNEWRFYAFADAATLRLRETLPEQDASYSLASAAARMQVLDWLSGSLDWGYPLKDGPNAKTRSPPELQLARQLLSAHATAFLPES